MDKTVTNSRKSTQEAGLVRLDSWKEIATYLGKSIRTVQRWEEQEKLPIHRLPHADRSSVFAFSQELDAWRASRSHLLRGNGNDSEANGAASGEATTANPLPGLGDSWARPRRWRLAVLTAVVVLAASGLIVFFTRPAPSVQILNYTQLTHDGKYKDGLATDGKWAYFIEQGNGGKDLCKVLVQGGEITRVPLHRHVATSIAVSPDGAKLLIGEASWFNQLSNLWVYSISGSLLHPVGGGVSLPFAWAPAQKILYAQGHTIWTCDEDGAHKVKVVNAPDDVYEVGWSPDAKRIWYTTREPGGSPFSTGEVDTDGNNQRRIFEGKGTGVELCCGFWSPSGASFGFVSSSTQRTDLLVTPDSSPWFYRSRPVSQAGLGTPQISKFASDSAHNRFLVLAGGPWHENVFRFDRMKGQFTAYFDGISARDIDFSPDGRSAVYTDGYDGSLWRYDLEERRKTRLAGPPFYALLPRWSPDGQWIAMSGSGLEGRWKIYRIPSQGGTPEPLIANDEDAGAPTWSPDGKSLTFAKIDCLSDEKCGVYQYDLARHSLQMLPGSRGFRTARWSPNGKYIAALRSTDQFLMLFDFATQHWREIYGPVRGDILTWSRDSKCVFGYGPKGDNPCIFRVAVLTGAMEQVADLKGLMPPGKDVLPWFGLAPDDSLIVSRETGENEIFSVSYQIP